MKKALLITLLIFTHLYVFASLSRKDSIGITKINGKFHLRYMVSPGETVYRISTKYKVPISDLIDLNPELEFGLKTGQIILIPYNKIAPEEEEKVVAPAAKPVPASPTVVPAAITPASTALAPGDTITEQGVVHVVKPGETFSSLSRKYGISVDELAKMNNIELKAGQKIVVDAKTKATAKSNTALTKMATTKTEPVAEVKKEQPSAPLPQENPLDDEPAVVKNLVPEEYENTKMHLLVVPFDPYLYFSDADDEISAGSKMQRTKVRQAFRRRLNALLEPQGYETIHLLGGNAKDSLTDLNKIYSSVTYSYQDLLLSPYNTRMEKDPVKVLGGGGNTQKKASGIQTENSRASLAKDPQKYFGVKINNADFFTYFNNKYRIDYYLFVNQFEVKTNYEHCLDRATLNYERGFITHYSIFDKNGKQIAGNRIYIDYNSNTNSISKILTDNMQKVADRIMADLPKAK